MGADIDLRISDGSESRFSAFVERLVSVIGHVANEVVAVAVKTKNHSTRPRPRELVVDEIQ